MIYKLLDWKCDMLVLVTATEANKCDMLVLVTATEANKCDMLVLVTATEANSSTIIWFNCVTLDEVLPNLNTLKVMWLFFFQ